MAILLSIPWVHIIDPVWNIYHWRLQFSIKSTQFPPLRIRLESFKNSISHMSWSTGKLISTHNMVFNAHYHFVDEHDKAKELEVYLHFS